MTSSISIACWLVVFSPQIIENFRRSSTEGLSIFFVMIWLTGDVFNVLGAVLQGVLPTMIILAVYYAFADTVLLSQCLYYRGFSLSDKPVDHSEGHKTFANGDANQPTSEEPTETSPLLIHPDDENIRRRSSEPSEARLAPPSQEPATLVRRSSSLSVRSALSGASVSAVHLSPATPMISSFYDEAPAARNLTPTSTLQAAFFNFLAILIVCAAGIFGWWLSATRHRPSRKEQPTLPAGDDDLDFDTWGQVFGYLCASFYLGSRVPQLLLNWRRKSTEGVSMLFFLFACVGNLTYVLSIFAYEPPCAKTAMLSSVAAPLESGWKGRGPDACADGEWAAQYGKYILVNASWLCGSAGTFFLDLCVFAQFWLYRGNAPRRMSG